MLKLKKLDYCCLRRKHTWEPALTELSPSKTEEKWGMEIKSPFSKAGMTVEEACKTRHFFLLNLVMEQ